MKQPDWSTAPEGATHYMPKREESEWWRAVFWAMDTSGKPVTAWAVNDDGTLEQYARPTWSEKDRARLIPRQATPQWNGEGLPPVGCECEALWSSATGEYVRVVVVGYDHDQSYAVYRIISGARAGEYESSRQSDIEGHPCFRPTRTPEQIAAEEREKAINIMIQLFEHDELIKDSLGKLYDAGYRKQETAK